MSNREYALCASVLHAVLEAEMSFFSIDLGPEHGCLGFDQPRLTDAEALLS